MGVVYDIIIVHTGDYSREDILSSAQDQAREKIRRLVDKYASMTPEDGKNMTEASVVNQFLDPFLEALGWPIKDHARYKYEPSTQTGRPDMVLIPDKSGAVRCNPSRLRV